MVLGMPMTLSGRPRRARLRGDGAGPLEGAVAADGKEDADPQFRQVIHHLGRFLRPPGGGQDRAPQIADLAHRTRCQFKGGVAEALDQPLVAVAEAVDPAHAVVVVEAQGHGTDHVVDPRAESAAGDDAAGDGRRVEEQPLPRAGQLQNRRFFPGLDERPDVIETGVIQDLLAVVQEAPIRHGGREATFAELFDGEIKLPIHHESPPEKRSRNLFLTTFNAFPAASLSAGPHRAAPADA